MVDDEILSWLTEAYHLAGGTLARHQRSLSGEDHDGGDGIVPDDIDDPFL